jgi:hypothetical protein
MRLDNLELTAYMTLVMTWRKYIHPNDTNEADHMDEI